MDRELLHTRLEGNFTFKSLETGFSATPDLTLISTPRDGNENAQVLAIVECAFSQDRDSLREKIKKEILARPEIVLAIMICVTESQSYARPSEGSEAWKFFFKDPEGRCRDAKSFFHVRPSDESSSDVDERYTLRPIVIAGHTWCDIASIEYFLWVKDRADKPIDVDEDLPTREVRHFSFGQISQSHTNIVLPGISWIRIWFRQPRWTRSSRNCVRGWRRCNSQSLH